MKVFISWSGTLSKKVAEILKPWIKCVLQVTEPFMSAEDIDKGTLWFNVISDQLADTAVGIICLTRDNLDEPWILFEAGSLAKGLSKTRVCTFLVDIETKDLEPPLSQFNATSATEEDLFRLVTSINNALGDKRLSEEILGMTFKQFWGSFKAKFDAIIKSHKPSKQARRTQVEIVEEILDICRSVQRHIQEPKTLGLSTLVAPISATTSNPGLEMYHSLLKKQEEETKGELIRQIMATMELANAGNIPAKTSPLKDPPGKPKGT